MNRLFYNRCYLSGPIDNAPDLGVGWRLKVQQELADLDIIFLNPCNKPLLLDAIQEDLENHKLRQSIKESSNFDTLSQIMREVRCYDLRMADLCDFAIIHLDLNTYSTGTHEEITTMNRRKVPILIHVEQGKSALPEWYFGTFPHQMVFGTWKELFNYIRYVAYASPPIKTYNRWRFIDYGTLYKKREIIISNGMVAKVSPEDFDYLMQWKWTAIPQNNNSKWRAMRKITVAGRKFTRYMHQEVILRRISNIPDNSQIDHIDRNPLNNEYENLRVVTASENQHNCGPQANNTTSVKGVWKNSTGKYVVELICLGVKHRIGTFLTLEKAKIERDKYGQALLKDKYYGE